MDKNLEIALDNYLAKEDVEGAFYIDGDWGSGKSFFIRNYREKIDEEYRKKNPKSKDPSSFYVSLNGLRNLNDINAELFALCHPKLSCFSSSKFGKGLLYLGKAAGNVFGIESENTEGVISNFAGVFQKGKTQILILDDFERCRIDLQELFGYLSSLLVESGTKVILIGNDKEVRRFLQEEELFRERSISAQISGNMEEYKQNLASLSEPCLYDSIKEKCIYKTYHFQFDDEILFEELVKDYPESTRLLVKNNRDSIKNILRSYGCRNLRTCKVALENFNHIAFEVLDGFSCENELKDVVLLSTFLYTIFFKTGKKEKSFADIIGPGDEGTKMYPIEGIEKYVYRSVWNKELILAELTNINKDLLMRKSKALPKTLIDLRGDWYQKTDDQIKKEIYDLKDSLENVPVNYCCMALFYFELYKSWFRDNGINLKDIKKSLVGKIKSSKEEIDVGDPSFLIKSYPDCGDIEYDLDELKEECKKRNIDLGNKTLFSMKSGALASYTAEERRKIEDEAFRYKCFFSRLNIEELVETIKRGEPKDISNIRIFLRNVYRDGNIREYFKDDIPSLEDFKERVSSIKCKSVVKTKVIDSLLKDLDDYLLRLRLKFTF